MNVFIYMCVNLYVLNSIGGTFRIWAERTAKPYLDKIVSINLKRTRISPKLNKRAVFHSNNLWYLMVRFKRQHLYHRDMHSMCIECYSCTISNNCSTQTRMLHEWTLFTFHTFILTHRLRSSPKSDRCMRVQLFLYP